MQKWLISAQSLKECRHKSLVVRSGLRWKPKKLRFLCESRNFSSWNDRAQPEHGLTRTQTLLSDFEGHSCFSSMLNSAWIFLVPFLLPSSLFLRQSPRGAFRPSAGCALIWHKARTMTVPHREMSKTLWTQMAPPFVL